MVKSDFSEIRHHSTFKDWLNKEYEIYTGKKEGLLMSFILPGMNSQNRDLNKMIEEMSKAFQERENLKD